MGNNIGVRLAGYSLNRDGYAKNITTGHDVDGRDQWALQSLTATTPSVEINLKGNELPHSPSAKIKVGAQYQTDPVFRDWTATLRVDATWQDSYHLREYNTPTDRIDPWSVIDLQARLENAPRQMSVRLFVKNLTGGFNITNIIIEDALIGRYCKARLLEQRTFGVIVEKRF